MELGPAGGRHRPAAQRRERAQDGLRERRIRSGQPYYDRAVGEGKDRKLLAATVVPVVMAKCAECHEDRKVGEVPGFLRYEVPVK